MPEINIPWPEKGISEGRANDSQPQLTTRDAVNVRGVDPTNGRVRGAQRSGMSMYSNAPVVSSTTKVQDLTSVTYDNKKTTYSAEVQDTSASTIATAVPSNLGSYQCVVDTQSNVYAIDGKSAVVKYNSELTEVWKLNVELQDQAAELRTIAVDNSFWVFIGVGSGGDMKKARIYAYEQRNNPFGGLGETDLRAEKVWEFNAGGFVEKIDVRQGKIYAAINDTNRGRSWVVVLDQINTAVPIEQKRWDIPYPANDISVSPKDGAIYTAHEPNDQRGRDLKNTTSHASWVDWTPELLPSYAKRVYGWWDAGDIDGDGTNNSGYEEGDEITTWYDKSGNGRDWDVNTVASGEKGPLLTKNFIGGRDMLVFDGVNRSMQSGKNPSASNVSSDKSSRAAFLSAIPGWEGAQFALFMVVRMSPEYDQTRMLLSQDQSSTHSFTTCRAILANSVPDSALSTNNISPGCIRLNLLTTGSVDTASGTGNAPLAQCWGPDDFCLITWIFNGGKGTVKSCLRVNGRPADQWDDLTNWVHTDPTFLGWSRGAIGTGTAATVQPKRFRGYVCEMLVLSDWYSEAPTPLETGTLQDIVTNPNYPTTAYSAAGTPTEVELIEGYLATKWCGGYKVPTGKAGVVKFTGNPSNNETVTIGSVQYRFQTTPAASPGFASVDIGTDQLATARNLYMAINRQGPESATTYFSDTSSPTANNSVVALGVASYDSTAVPYNCAVFLQSRDPLAGSITFTETATNVAVKPSGGFLGNPGANAPGVGDFNTGHFPHRFYYVRLVPSETRGGPPSSLLDANSNGVTPISPYSNLHHFGGMLCKWDPLASKLKWVATSGSNGNTTVVYGGIGYACAADLDGGVYTVGPPQTLTTVPMLLTGSVDTSTIRRFTSNGLEFTASSLLSASSGSTNLVADKHLRIGTDKYSNGYVPVFTASNSNDASQPYSLYVYNKSGTLLHRYSEPNASHLVYSAAVDPQIPANIGDDLSGTTQTSQPRAEYVFMSGRVENSSLLTFTGQPSASDTVVISGNTYTFVSPLAAAITTTQVEIGASLQDTILNLSNAINGIVGGSYVFGTVAPNTAANTVFRATALSSTTLRVRRITPLTSESQLSSVLSVTGSFGAWSSDTAAFDPKAVFRAKLVNTSPTTGSPRSVKILAVSGGSIKSISTGSSPASVNGGAFSVATSEFVQSTTLNQKVYYTNGEQYLVYNPKTNQASEWKSTSGGKIPPRCKLIDNWRNRIVLGRSAEDPQNWHMSASGDPNNWDQFPPVITASQAVSGNNARAGRCPDIVNAIIPYSDDLLIFGGETSIWRMTGDPMAGGQFDLISDVDGIAFGRAWDKDDSGALYFFGSRGGLYRATPTGGVKKISGEAIDDRLREINLGQYYVRCVWNDADDCLHMFVMPFGNGGVHLKHFVYEARTGAFYQDEFGTTSAGGTAVQPTAAMVMDGDDPDDRTLLIGCEDGYVRKWDADARNDGAAAAVSAIDSQVVFGPFNLNEETEARLTAVNLLLAKEQQGCRVQLFVSDTPDDLGIAIWTGDFAPGRNDWRYIRGRGRYIWVKLRSSLYDTRWAFENMVARVERAGRARVRNL